MILIYYLININDIRNRAKSKQTLKQFKIEKNNIKFHLASSIRT